MVVVAELFVHGGFDEPVGEGEAAFEGEGLGDLEVGECHFGGLAGWLVLLGAK